MYVHYKKQNKKQPVNHDLKKQKIYYTTEYPLFLCLVS